MMQLRFSTIACFVLLQVLSSPSSGFALDGQHPAQNISILINSGVLTWLPSPHALGA
jgi:hypothetical protein